MERRGSVDGMRLAFIGDGNNMVHSWMLAAARLGFEFVLACPKGYEPDPDILAEVRAAAPGRLHVPQEAKEAARGADVLYTDVWTSMGQEAETERRRKVFAPYQVNAALLELAAPEALVMHCLPAHRGEEITAEVIDGPRAVILDQAENRLHIQKAILAWLAGAPESQP
jgi:ornithine carbamoyltransferase